MDESGRRLPPDIALSDARQNPPIYEGYVEYIDPSTRQKLKVFHPDISGVEKMPRQQFQPGQMIDVKMGEKNIPASFHDYLGMMGANHAEYLTEFKTGDRNSDLFRKLHKKSLERRLQEAIDYQNL